MDTMMALRAHTRGGPEQLVYEQAPAPVPGPGEALVAVRAAAITFAELTWDQTWTTGDGRDRTPVIPAHEVAGTVAGLGAGAAGIAVGDEVYGLIDFNRNGAAAQYVTIPAADLAAAPRSVPTAEAATLPLAALTAWQALADHAVLQPGEKVLVLGGAGGVGVYAVQLAAGMGGRVTATGSNADAEFVRGLGAAEFVAARDAAAAGLTGFDVVIDTVSAAASEAAWSTLRPGGRLVTLSVPPSQELAQRLGVKATFFVVTPDAAELAQLAGLTDAGRLRPVLSQQFPLSEGRRAFESGSRHRPPGKTVLIVA